MAEDEPMSDAVEAAEAAVDAQPLTSFPFLLQDVATAQAQHGLRHGDFGRYRRGCMVVMPVFLTLSLTRLGYVRCRRYCARRLRRLCAALKYSHGTKSRYTPRKLTPADVIDARRVALPRRRCFQCRGVLQQQP